MPDSKSTAERKINQKYRELIRRRRNLGRKVGTIVDAPYGGWYQVYQRGRIYSHHSVGTYEVHGNNLTRYLERNQFDRNLRIGRREFGFPTADEGRTPDNRYPLSQFEWGQIIGVRGTYGGVSISGNIYKHWRGIGAGSSELGYPINGNVRVAGGEAVFFEKGCLFFDKNKNSKPFTIAINPPRMECPSILKPTDKLLEFTLTMPGVSSFRNLGGTQTLAQIFNYRYYLQEVGTYRRIPLILQTHSMQNPREVTVHLSIPANRKLKDRTLYNLVFRMDNRRYYALSPHAVYAKEAWDNFGFIHATDLHVSKRIDGFWQVLKQKMGEENANKLNNFNNNFRDLIRYANVLHSQGKLDFILATGDIVDYQYEIRGRRTFERYYDGLGWHQYALPTFDGPTSHFNFDFFKELVLGKSRYAGKDAEYKKQEELKVPIFITYGNHDYRKLPYELLFQIEAPFKTVQQDYYKEYDLRHKGEDEEANAKALQGGYKYRFSYDSDRTKDMVRPNRLKEIEKKGNYVVKLGKHRIVMINSGSDVGVTTGFWDAIGAYLSGNEDKNAFLGGHPNSEGIINNANISGTLRSMDKEGLVIVGLHAPPLNIKGNEYAHYFRETEHPFVDEKEIFEFVRRDNNIIPPSTLNVNNETFFNYVKEKYADWFTGRSAYFKKGRTEDLLDWGTSKGKVDEFLEYCVGKRGNKKADLVLFGHIHNDVEFRLEWDDKEDKMLYFMDFYSENPTHYYPSTKHIDGKNESVDIVVDHKVTSAGRVKKVDGNLELSVPPYSNPLNTTPDAEKWWDEHRPLFMQSAPLGPLDRKFQGCRLIYVADDMIKKIHRVHIKELRKNNADYSIPETGVTGNTWLEPVLNIMMTT